MSTTDDVAVDGVPVALRDGSHVRIRQEGVRTFTAWMLAQNREMMDLFQHLGPVQVDQEAGTVEIEVPLPAAGAAPELRELLRVAAEHDVAVPVTRRR
jgi:hypothetical protein